MTDKPFLYAVAASCLGVLIDDWHSMLLIWIIVSVAAIAQESTSSAKHAWRLLAVRGAMILFGALPVCLGLAHLTGAEAQNFAAFAVALISWRGPRLFGDATKLATVWRSE